MTTRVARKQSAPRRQDTSQTPVYWRREDESYSFSAFAEDNHKAKSRDGPDSRRFCLTLLVRNEEFSCKVGWNKEFKPFWLKPFLLELILTPVEPVC